MKITHWLAILSIGSCLSISSFARTEGDSGTLHRDPAAGRNTASAPSRPEDLNNCIGCHTGAMPGVKSISFAADRADALKGELKANNKALLIEMEKRISASAPAAQHMPPGGQVDEAKVKAYLDSLAP